MTHPDFYHNIQNIKVQDPLASFLGAFDEGSYEFSYLDIVKSAGHSCPTVLGAYMMVQEAIKALYEDGVAQRGDIKIEFKDEALNGVAGVIANVMSNLLGSTTNMGFKGIAGIYDRRHLMFFNEDIEGNVKFTRRDTKKSVEVIYDANCISHDAKMSPLMQKCIAKTANNEEQKEFGILWQKRVEEISLNTSKVITVIPH